ncbi:MULTISPECIES: NUDIX hydrolase [Bacillus]|uniref:NUDIX hydrolase n=1 Tax=Bacillus TaxID=1386 RepID=UPI0003FC3D2C|nr:MULTISPECIES: NUDIX hydrolase [Bacillus]QHZ48227.1 NUDIX hydrolase [Bacillus sp. NSP9.1]WFA06109.1 NUDIX hydrolase [Bacillus sp. HSf4]
MRKNLNWLDWAKELQAIAQAGLAYTKDEFDQERFERLRQISCEIIAEYSDADFLKVQDVFAGESGYPTPKVDVRAVIFKDDRLLFVQEKADGKWALPGGWADIGLSPKEIAVKEAFEETGLKVKAQKLLAVMDKKCHNHPPSAFHVYKMFIACDIVGGKAEPGMETNNIGFFPLEHLPELSEARNTYEQIEFLFQTKNDSHQVYCD